MGRCMHSYGEVLRPRQGIARPSFRTSRGPASRSAATDALGWCMERRMVSLEAQLTALTQDFVARLIDAIRGASFAEVAALSTGGRAAKGESSPRRRPGRPA